MMLWLEVTSDNEHRETLGTRVYLRLCLLKKKKRWVTKSIFLDLTGKWKPEKRVVSLDGQSEWFKAL